MLGLENPIHIAIVLVIVLLVFGAKRLPEMGHSLGSGLRNFKHSINGAAESQPEQLPATGSDSAASVRSEPPAA